MLAIYEYWLVEYIEYRIPMKDETVHCVLPIILKQLFVPYEYHIQGSELLLTWESNYLVFCCWNFLRWLDIPIYYLIQSGIGVIHVVRSAQRNTQTVKKSEAYIGAAEVGAREKKKDKSF